MANLTRTDIESGKVIRLNKITTPVNLNEEKISYNIIYEIDNFKYRINLNQNFNSNQELVKEIFDYLLTVEKKDINNLPIRPETTIEEISSLIGQSISDNR
jgi:hypothetical protein